MSFRFDWSTVASKELLRDIRTRINTVLYKVASKDNYQGNTMHLLSLDLGTEVCGGCYLSHSARNSLTALVWVAGA